MKIVTEDQYYGFVAIDDDRYDGPGSHIGSGRTEQDAVSELLDQLEEDESYGDLVESIRAERIKHGLSPDTGSCRTNQTGK